MGYKYYEVSSGVTSTGLVLNEDNVMDVSSGGTANNTTVNSGGDLYVYFGGTANSTTVNSMGYVCVSSGGTANNTTVNSYGTLTISLGGMANRTTIKSSGCLVVNSSGIAASTTIYGNGELSVSSGGIISNTKAYAGCTVRLANSAKMTGKMNLAAGAVIFVENGAVVDFDLTQISAGGKALLTDWSLLQGKPDYTLTVNANQANGVYTLANGAEDFEGTIAVQNATGESLGMLSVGGTLNVGGTEYTLNLDGEALSVGIVSGIVPWTFFSGDFNGDLYDTLAVESGSAVTIYQNYEPWGLGVTLDPGWTVVGTGDFSGDGLDDFLRVNDEGYVVGEMSNGNGTFSPQVLNLKNAGWEILGTGDFNGNGTVDVLIANPTGTSETVGLLGYWESGVTWTLINGYSPEWECISTGDFNGDGKCDMLWKNSFAGDDGNIYNAYCTWIVDNPVDWRMVSVANPAEWNFLCSGDFNKDGMNDIAMINDVGVVGIWGVKDGYLSTWSILSAVTPEWQLAGVGDFNADGTDDIAWCSSTTGQIGAWIVKDKELSDWQILATLS